MPWGVRPRMLAALVATVGSALGSTPGALAQAPRPAGAPGAAPRPFLDVRQADRTAVTRRGALSLIAPSRATRAARARLRADGATIDVDEITGTPRVLAALTAPLSAPARGDRAEIAGRYLSDHLALLGLAATDLGSLKLEDRAAIPGGAQEVAYRQYADGIPSFDGALRVFVDARGEVVRLIGAPQPDLTLPTATPSLTAAEALRRLMDDVGVTRDVQVTSGPVGARLSTTFAGGETALLTVFAEGPRARLAWQLDYRAAPMAHYTALVDAATGAVLYRANSVKAANLAAVWETYPGDPAGGTAQPQDLVGYVTPPADPAVPIELSGPNAHAWSDTNDNDSATLGANGHIVPLDRPDNGERVTQFKGGFGYPFNIPATNAPGACDTSHPCSWDHRSPASWQANREQNAVQAFYFVNRFHDHLGAAPISFTPADGAIEGPDRLLVNSDDGAALGNFGGPDANHINQAYMDTPPNGTSPTMAMFLFSNAAAPLGLFRDVNGGDDAAVVYHEYTHGLSSRLVTVSPGGEQALNAPQAGAMGEAWSDWYAQDFLVSQFPGTDTAAPGEVDMGRYVDAVPHSIRTEALDCPVSASAARCPGTTAEGSGGYTFGDFNSVPKVLPPPGSPAGTPPAQEVHQAGEIWAQTLWDLREALGPAVTEAIVTQGMRMSPPEPTFLDERDAILAADRQLFAGADHNAQIWATFAARGMGWDARSPTATSVTEGTALPPAGTPTPTPSPTPTPTPSPTPTPAPVPDGGAPTPAGPSPTPAPGAGPRTLPSAPTLSLRSSGTRGVVGFAVQCATACSGSARLGVSTGLARRLGIGGAMVGSARVVRSTAGRSTFTIRLTRRVLSAMARRHVRALTATLSVTVADVGGPTAASRLTVKVSR